MMDACVACVWRACSLVLDLAGIGALRARAATRGIPLVKFRENGLSVHE
jgi:hypothetical protein